MIDTNKSKNVRHHDETSSSVTVQLNNPIQNAHSVEVASFSTSHEFFNVRQHNNSFKMFLYNLNTIANGGVDSVSKEYVIPEGLYTTQELVEACNEAMALDPFGIYLTPFFTVLGNNKVQLTASSTGTLKRRLFLFEYDHLFANSIIHRLGFTSNQVALSSNSNAIQGYSTPGSITLSHPLYFLRYIDDNIVLLFDQNNTQYTEAEWIANETKPLLWKTDGTGQSHSGRSIGFEAYPNLILKSSLIAGSKFQSVHKEQDGKTHVKQDSILQVISVDVPMYSYLHWRGGLERPFTHTLSGKPVQNFTIELCDDQGLPFSTTDTKDWSCVLRFETAEEDNYANETQILRNQQLSFKARHNCSR